METMICQAKNRKLLKLNRLKIQLEGWTELMNMSQEKKILCLDILEESTKIMNEIENLLMELDYESKRNN